MGKTPRTGLRISSEPLFEIKNCLGLWLISPPFLPTTLFRKMIHGASVQRAIGLPKPSKTLDLNVVPATLSAPTTTTPEASAQVWEILYCAICLWKFTLLSSFFLLLSLNR